MARAGEYQHPMDRIRRRTHKLHDGCWMYVGQPSHNTSEHRPQLNLKAHPDWGYAPTVPRVVWHYERGPIPGGLMVLHTCHRARCVNPDHLYLGDHEQNMRDMAEHGSVKGQKHPSSKLDDEQVREIRELYIRQYEKTSRGPWRSNARELAEKFGVDRRTISDIVTGTRWGHLA